MRVPSILYFSVSQCQRRRRDLGDQKDSLELETNQRERLIQTRLKLILKIPHGNISECGKEMVLTNHHCRKELEKNIHPCYDCRQRKLVFERKKKKCIKIRAF